MQNRQEIIHHKVTHIAKWMRIQVVPKPESLGPPLVIHMWHRLKMFRCEAPPSMKGMIAIASPSLLEEVGFLLRLEEHQPGMILHNPGMDLHVNL